MFYCCSCGAFFETPLEVVDEMLDCRGAWYPRYVYVSPCCDADYLEAQKCSACGEFVCDEDAFYCPDGSYMCKNCYHFSEFDG